MDTISVAFIPLQGGASVGHDVEEKWEGGIVVHTWDASTEDAKAGASWAWATDWNPVSEQTAGQGSVYFLS